MKTRLIPTLSLVCLGVLAGLAQAAPTAKPGAPAKPGAAAKPTTSCSTLTAAQCKADPRWSEVATCSSAPTPPKGMTKCSAAQLAAAADPCTAVHAAQCKTVIAEAVKKDPSRASATKSKVMKVDGENLPADLKEGFKRSSYGKPKPGRELAVAGKNVIARSGLTRAPGYAVAPPAAAKAHRKPAWDSNGQAIHSCQEFAYEELYDGMRYVDAVGACAGDRSCEVAVAYLKDTPGIARRKLKRKDGKAIARQLETRDTGTFAKNDIFIGRREFAYAIDPAVDAKVGPDGRRHGKKTKEMDEIASVLDQGKQWYGFGCTSDCGPRKFKNEWGFHDKLRERNKLSLAEFAEYERRKAEFRELEEAWVVAAKEAIARIKYNRDMLDKRINKPRVAKVSRLDMVSGDPFERQQILLQGVDSAVSQKAKAGTPAVDIPNVGAAGYGALEPSAATGVLAAPSAAARPGASRPAVPRVGLPHCSPQHWTDLSRDPNMDDLHFGGPASCAIADFLKEEYRRKAAGQKSCLDLGDDDCDWSPEMFHGRFVASFPYGEELQGYEDYCQRWTGGTIDVDNLAAAEKYIDKMKQLVGVALQKVGPYKESQVDVGGKKLWQLGSNWVDAQSFGDKDWFAAGYDYDVGWHIHPVKLAADKRICALTGNAHGSFGVDAWLLGGAVDVVQATSHFKTNVKNEGVSHFDARLQILGEDLFDAIDADFTTAWAPTDGLGGAVDLPPGWKPSITVMAGPIPVTGSAWGSLYYDAVMSADAKVAKTKGACKPDNVQFLIQGMVQPDLGVAGYLEVGAGIGGLLSAGIRGSLTLVSLGLPLHVKLQAHDVAVDGKNKQPMASFDAGLELSVATLSGYIALYIEFLFFEDEWELFSWSGVSDEVALMDPALSADLPLVGWPQ